MKLRTTRLAAGSISALAVALALNTCAWQGETLYMNPKTPGLIAIDPKTPVPPGFHAIWRDDRTTFAVSPSAGDLLKEAHHSRLGSGIVAIHFPLNQDRPRSKALIDRFAKDPRALAVVTHAADGQGTALVRFSSPAELASLAHEAHRLSLNSRGGELHSPIELLGSYLASTPGVPPAPVFREDVRMTAVSQLLEIPTKTGITATIQALQDLGTRYHNKPSGLQTPATVQDMMSTAGSGITGLTFTQITHAATPQKSIIATIPGQSSTVGSEIIVLSAHLDSINPSDLNVAPGADDNASGIATLVEILHAISQSGATFDRTIEFHAYAAEELGLVGSNDIVGRYKSQGKKVRAVMNFDMTAYLDTPGDLTIHLLSTDTTADARRSAKDLLSTYQDGGFNELPLPAGTSDHRSWFAAGYHAVFPFEHPTKHNPSLHSANDTLANCNGMDLALRITKLGLSFAAHQAGLSSAADEYAAALATEDRSKDLKIAMLASEKDQWTMAVAAPTNVQGAEFCVLSAASDTSCASPRQVMTSVGTGGESRRYFVAPAPLTWVSPSHVRVFGYNDKDAPVALRNARLERN